MVTFLFFVWICSKANGYTDPFYIRFTTPKQNSLIIGTSRAAQGLQPKIVDPILKVDISNYSFTVAHSPFGKTYLNSIKKKVNKNSKKGIFIIAVDPWSIASFTKTPNDSLLFRELRLALKNMWMVSLNPNPIYIMNNWNKKYYKLLTNKKSKVFLHNDGWLEVNVNLSPVSVSRNITKKVSTYRKNILPKAKFSENRFNYLKQTILFLKKHGDVFLVRLPIHPKIMEMENELMPNFNDRILEAIKLSNGFLDLTSKNSDFNYTDGNHLHKNSGKEVSEITANWIYNIKNNSTGK